MVVVGTETRSTGDLHDRFGVLEPYRPLAADASCGGTERLSPAHLSLPIEDLADRTAEVQGIGKRRRVHEIGPGLPGQEIA